MVLEGHVLQADASEVKIYAINDKSATVNLIGGFTRDKVFGCKLRIGHTRWFIGMKNRLYLVTETGFQLQLGIINPVVRIVPVCKADRIAVRVGIENDRLAVISNVVLIHIACHIHSFHNGLLFIGQPCNRFISFRFLFGFPRFNGLGK